MNNLIKLIACLVFCLLLTIPPIAGLSIKEKILLNEKREITQFPKLKLIKKDFLLFTKQINEYTNDNLGFREQFIMFFNLLKFKMNSSPNKDVLIGKNKWLFYKGDKNLENCLQLDTFSKKQINIWEIYLRAQKNIFDRANIAYSFFIPPNKCFIYPEFFPYPIDSKALNNYQLMLSLLRKIDIPTYDIKNLLLKKKNEYIAYPKTDTHWSFIAALDALIQIYKVNNINHKLIPSMQRENLEFENFDYKKDLEKLINVYKSSMEPSQRLKRKKENYFTVKHLKTQFKHPKVINISHCKTCINKTLFIFRDSFGNNISRLLYGSFKNVVDISARFNDKLFQFATENVGKPDIILEESTERNLKDLPLIESRITEGRYSNSLKNKPSINLLNKNWEKNLNSDFQLSKEGLLVKSKNKFHSLITPHFNSKKKVKNYFVKITLESKKDGYLELNYINRASQFFKPNSPYTIKFQKGTSINIFKIPKRKTSTAFNLIIKNNKKRVTIKEFKVYTDQKIKTKL